jgi:hypothetical protein
MNPQYTTQVPEIKQTLQVIARKLAGILPHHSRVTSVGRGSTCGRCLLKVLDAAAVEMIHGADNAQFASLLHLSEHRL